MLRKARVRYAPRPLLRQPDFRVALIASERIAAGRHKIDDPVEGRPVEGGVRRGTDDFLVELPRIERGSAGAAKDVLGKNVERAGNQRRCVLRAKIVGFERDAAFENLEAVCRNKQRLGRLVHAMVRAADALGKPARPFRRTDMDDEIDIAPVDTEIERRCRDDRAQAVGFHRLFHPPPLAHVQRAVMQRDWQRIVIHAPKLLEEHLRLAARVDEEQRRAVLSDRLVDIGSSVARRVPGPGDKFLRIED